MGDAAQPSDKHMSHSDTRCNSHKKRNVCDSDRPIAAAAAASIYIFTQYASGSRATHLQWDF